MYRKHFHCLIRMYSLSNALCPWSESLSAYISKIDKHFISALVSSYLKFYTNVLIWSLLLCYKLIVYLQLFIYYFLIMLVSLHHPQPQSTNPSIGGKPYNLNLNSDWRTKSNANPNVPVIARCTRLVWCPAVEMPNWIKKCHLCVNWSMWNQVIHFVGRNIPSYNQWHSYKSLPMTSHLRVRSCCWRHLWRSLYVLFCWLEW